MTPSSDLVHAVAMETKDGHLTVFCALTPCYEHRATRIVGESGVRRIKAVAERLAKGQSAGKGKD